MPQIRCRQFLARAIGPLNPVSPDSTLVTASHAIGRHDPVIGQDHGLHRFKEPRPPPDPVTAALAEEKGVGLMFEAAVAGGIPAVKALREGLSGNRISRVSGILNGTCNYILTRMEKTGEAFADVLSDAQKLGYAEAEPSLDVDGIDAAHKLTILAAIAFGQTPQFDRVAISAPRWLSWRAVSPPTTPSPAIPTRSGCLEELSGDMGISFQGSLRPVRCNR